MNKYEKFYNKTEVRSQKRSRKKQILFTEKLILKLISKGEYINYDDNLLEYCIFNLSDMDKDFVEWFKKNLIEKYDKTVLYFNYISALNYLTCPIKSDKSDLYKVDLNALMESFITSGLIKDIKRFDETTKNENIKTVKKEQNIICTNNSKMSDFFQITMPNDEKIVFSRMTDSQQDAENADKHCHAYSEVLMQRDILNNTSACCGHFKDLFGYNHYHTFVVSQGIVYDFSNNIKMSFNSYIKLFNFKILLQEEKDTLFSKIKYLSETDTDFDKSKKNNILKLTIDNLIDNSSKIK